MELTGGYNSYMNKFKMYQKNLISAFPYEINGLIFEYYFETNKKELFLCMFYLISSSMNSEFKEHLKCTNCFYKIRTEQHKKNIRKSLLSLSSIYLIMSDPHINKRVKQELVQKVVTKHMAIIEYNKIDIMKNCIKDTLKINNSKIIMMCVSLNSIDTLESYCRDILKVNNIVIHGSVPKQERSKRINLFQENSDNCRVLIGQIDTLAEGIDLDDKYGSFPRYLFIIPDFRFLRLQQAMRRIIRIDTKSSATVNIIYTELKENTIMNKILKKSNILKEVLTVNKHKTDQIYADKFETFHET